MYKASGFLHPLLQGGGLEGALRIAVSTMMQQSMSLRASPKISASFAHASFSFLFFFWVPGFSARMRQRSNGLAHRKTQVSQ